VEFLPLAASTAWPSRPLKGWMKPVLSCAKLALIFIPLVTTNEQGRSQGRDSIGS
jgi:hypothetical protein